MEIFTQCDDCGFIEFNPLQAPSVCGECGSQLVKPIDLPSVGGRLLRLQREVKRLTDELLIERGKL